MTSPGIGGGGFMGVALETVPNTYVAPSKYVPIRSESLKFAQDTAWRRPIRQSVDNMGPVAGPVRIEGEVQPEATHDVVPWFLLASRATCVKAGAGPYTYTFTPNALATPPAGRTASLTVVRNGQVFAFVGCVVGGYTFSIDNGQLTMSCNILGSDESTQSLPVATWTDIQPYGAGEQGIEIPAATAVTDTSAFSFQVNDNPEAQYRIKTTGRGAQFIKFGERQVTASMTRDFLSKTDFDAWKALTAQTFQFKASRSANDEITITAPAIIKNSYDLGLSSQGDLITASINYEMKYSTADSRAYQIVVKSSENITLP
jgi:hypothetical protein